MDKKNTAPKDGIQNTKEKFTTKQDKILNVFRTRSLNRFEAEPFGDHCLHSTVATLKRLGFLFVTKWEEVPTRFGKSCRVKRYYYLGRA